MIFRRLSANHRKPTGTEKQWSTMEKQQKLYLSDFSVSLICVFGCFRLLLIVMMFRFSGTSRFSAEKTTSEEGPTDADTDALVAAMLANVESSDNPVLAVAATGRPTSEGPLGQSPEGPYEALKGPHKAP